jgi:hypothetical protein
LDWITRAIVDKTSHAIELMYAQAQAVVRRSTALGRGVGAVIGGFEPAAQTLVEVRKSSAASGAFLRDGVHSASRRAPVAIS